MLRGGSWNNNNPDNLRAAYRNNKHPDDRNNNIGGRVVLAPQHSQPSTRVSDFNKSGSVFEGVPIDLPGLI
ncbi:MAG TPA: hypothetical protein DF383_11630 [Deltaproteobacteria bacterium]|nr:hypothetical protein [Deltaproteobacteria bacterium]